MSMRMMSSMDLETHMPMTLDVLLTRRGEATRRRRILASAPSAVGVTHQSGAGLAALRRMEARHEGCHPSERMVQGRPECDGPERHNEHRQTRVPVYAVVRQSDSTSDLQRILPAHCGWRRSGTPECHQVDTTADRGRTDRTDWITCRGRCSPASRDIRREMTHPGRPGRPMTASDHHIRPSPPHRPSVASWRRTGRSRPYRTERTIRPAPPCAAGGAVQQQTHVGDGAGKLGGDPLHRIGPRAGSGCSGPRGGVREVVPPRQAAGQGRRPVAVVVQSTTILPPEFVQAARASRTPWRPYLWISSATNPATYGHACDVPSIST